MKDDKETPQLSGIVVVGDRKDNLRSLARDYWGALDATKQTFELIFILDGHQDDEKIAEAISEIENSSAMVKILGSYPKAVL